MGRELELKKQFEEKMGELIKRYTKNIEDLNAQHCDDEANLEKIKLNIVDIFSKMFNASYKAVYGASRNAVLKNVVESNEDSYAKLYEAYMIYFERIPASWVEKREKSKALGLTKEFIIEDMKLNTKEEIKELFIKLYNSI